MIKDELKLLGTKMVEKQDSIYVKELGNIILEHKDLKQFLKSRLIMQITPLKIQTRKRKDYGVISLPNEITMHMEFSQGYKMVYNRPSLLERIKFFIFDLKLWIKTSGSGVAI